MNLDALAVWVPNEQGGKTRMVAIDHAYEALAQARAAALERIARLEKREQWAANLLDIAKRDAKLPATLLQGIAQFQDERRADFPKEEPR